jgi:hypothetical protein
VNLSNWKFAHTAQVLLVAAIGADAALAHAAIVDSTTAGVAATVLVVLNLALGLFSDSASKPAPVAK